MRGVSCQRADPGSGSRSASASNPEIGLLLALWAFKGLDMAAESTPSDRLKLSAIIVVKMRQIVVGGIGIVFQTEKFLKKYAGNKTAEDFIANQRHETRLYYKYKEYYGYVFYIGKKV